MPARRLLAPIFTLKKRTWLILLALAMVLVSLLGVIGISWYQKRKAPRDAQYLAQAALAAVGNNDHSRALLLFAEASGKNPGEMAYIEAAAQEAFLAGRYPEAKVYAQRAWAAGRHSLILLRALLFTSDQRDVRKSLEQADLLLGTINDEGERLSLRANLLIDLGQIGDSEKAWHDLLARKPDPELISKFSHLLIDQRRENDAYKILAKAQAEGHLNSEGYYDFIRIDFFNRLKRASAVAEPSHLEEIQALITQARSKGLTDTRLRFLEAQLQYVMQKSGAALSILEELSTPEKDVAQNLWRNQARLLRMVILCELGRGAEIASLKDIVRAKGPEQEGEDQLYEVLGNAGDEQGKLAALARAQKLLGSNSSLLLLEARLKAAMGQHELALQSYSQIDGLLAGAGSSLLEQALILQKLGRRDQAMGMVTVFHRFIGTTKKSLAILAGIIPPGGDPQASHVIAEALAAAGKNDPQMLTTAADFSLRQGNYAKAETLFDELSARSPGSQEARIGAVRVALAKGEWQRALSLCETESSSLPIETFRALALRGLGRIPESLDAFEKATAYEHPWELDIEDGLTAMSAGRIDRAQSASDRAVKTAPDNPIANELAATVALAKGNFVDAEAAARKAVAKEHTSYRDLLLIQALMEQGKDSEAMQAVQASLRNFPEDTALLVQRSLLKIRFGMLGEARQELEKLNQQHPQVASIERGLADCALRMHDGPAAGKWVGELLSRYPDAEEYLAMRVRAIALNGDIPKARAAIDALPASVSDSQKILLSAWIDDLTGNRDAGIARLEKHLHDQSIAVAWAKAVLNSQSAGATRVAPVLSKFKLPPQVLRDIIGLAERNARWRDAMDLAGQALEVHADDPIMLNNWAWYAIQLPHPDVEAAIAALEKARRLLPGSLAITDTYAEAQLLANRPSPARNAIEELGDRMRKDPQLLHDLGRAMQATGDHKGALLAFQQSWSLAKAAPVWPLREDKDSFAKRIAQEAGK